MKYPLQSESKAGVHAIEAAQSCTHAEIEFHKFSSPGRSRSPAAACSHQCHWLVGPPTPTIHTYYGGCLLVRCGALPTTYYWWELQWGSDQNVFIDYYGAVESVCVSGYLA
eukprot:GHVU01138901.1.p2 GENE.GHVU01138901.1~~GHVU01138901.1.p2  ORF type:complete len:111 (-),score=5.79 GHVU01138901.1:703-1035(-)